MKFLTTSTLALLVAAPMAFAQSTEGTVTAEEMENDTMQMAEGHGSTDMSDPAQLIRTRDITGGEIYTMNQADDEGWDPEFMYEEVNADWNQIGTIEDLVLNHSGEVVGVIAEIGGFLDIGDKHVMLEIDDLNLVAVDDMRYTYVTRFNEEDLEDMEGVDEGFWN
ncbi:hypothetical protein roselon_02818 [Roseibacterium elongatum DSM 19469]|uniref:PRC-barrel domain-containing protein n=1 Tax=Roseicyclus elongatus DSM 19469 TaxID=1294273 RepID=W8S841_9RHOB|nr:PRC-barrel domain-containing protein [Roseibacterium elongatum]AHM05116.1 hypothetical protein roselon_02818 [Roseibacterium elongatum DSM 19469]